MAERLSRTVPSTVADTLIPELLPVSQTSVQLTPETIVTCINRGRRPLTDMYNSQGYEMPPGLFRTQYQIAKLFQAHQCIPGSRNPETREQESWIGILNVDPPHKCEPFSDAELAAYDVLPGAVVPADSQVVATSQIQARMVGRGPTQGPDVSAQATPEAEAAAATALEAPDPEHNYALREMRENTAAAEAAGHQVDAGRRARRG